MKNALFSKTKIIATLGMPIIDIKIMEKLILAGVDVFRVNFSHISDEKTIKKIISNLNILNKKYNHNVALLGDLQGPKLRIGKVLEGTTLVSGKKIIVTSKEIISNDKILSVSYKDLYKDLKPKQRILIDDGNIVLEVIKKNKNKTLECVVIYGGNLKSNKGFNLPNTTTSLDVLTKKDKKDLKLIIKNDFDFVALSFVRYAKDVRYLKSILKKYKSDLLIVSKIEKPEALENIDEIIEESDVLMVARGDLGVEIPFQKVPVFQKELIKKARAKKKPIVIATQVMESMISNQTPTRAEINDAASAVFDMADAIMLSGETAIGKYPVKVVETLQKIINYVESRNKQDYKNSFINDDVEKKIPDLIGYHSTVLSNEAEAKGIISFTRSGYSARFVSSTRPKSNIFAFSLNKKTVKQLNICWGTKVFMCEKKIKTPLEVIEFALKILKKEKFVKIDDLVITMVGLPVKGFSKANSIILNKVK